MDKELGHWPATLNNVLAAARGLSVAASQMRNGPPRVLVMDSLHSALIAAEECRQAMKKIMQIEQPD